MSSDFRYAMFAKASATLHYLYRLRGEIHHSALRLQLLLFLSLLPLFSFLFLLLLQFQLFLSTQDMFLYLFLLEF